MKEYKKYAFIMLSVLAGWVSNGFAQTDIADYKIVDSKDIPGILSMLASVTEVNFEKIKTWNGRMTHEELLTIRGKRAAELFAKYADAEPNDSIDEIQQIVNSSIEYKIDMKNNRFFALSERIGPRVYLDTKSDKAYPSSKWKPEESIFIDTSEHQIEISPLSWTKDDAISSRIARKIRPGAIRITDPKEAFYIGEKTLWLSLSQLSQSLQIPGIEKFGVVIKKKSEGEQITYRIEISNLGRGSPFNVIVLNSAAGFNRTYIENWHDSGSLISKTTTEFVNQDGVFLPKKWKMSQYYQDGRLRRQEDCTIEEMQINKPVSDDVFSEFSYLIDGDRYNDEIQGKKYKVKAGKLVEETQ